ncbi:MAG: hypothetical protein ABIN89_05060 [Chitinophagaceae bacterium]
MQVYWSGPGFSRQPIPDAAFIEASPLTVRANKTMGDVLKMNDIDAKKE